MSIRKGNLVKHNVTGATATVESVNTLTNTFKARGDTRTFSLADFTAVPRKVGRPKAKKATADTFLKQINGLRVGVPTDSRELAINGIIGLINQLVAGK